MGFGRWVGSCLMTSDLLVVGDFFFRLVAIDRSIKVFWGLLLLELFLFHFFSWFYDYSISLDLNRL